MSEAGMHLPRPIRKLSLAPENTLAVAAGKPSGLQPSVAAPPGLYQRLCQLGADSLVVAILSPFLAMTSEWAPRIFLAIAILDIPLQLGVEPYYRPIDAWLGAEGGLSISLTTGALAVLYASWFIRALARKDGETRPRVHINLPLTLYLGFAALSLVVAQDAPLGFFEVFLLLQMYLLYVYVANFVRTRRDVLFVVSLLLVGCLLESSIMIALRFNGVPSSLVSLTTSHIHVQTGGERDEAVRVGGTVGSPNDAAGYLSLLLAPATASLLFTSLGRKYKWLAAAVIGLGGVALIFTFSRGGWVAFALSITMLCLFTWRRRGGLSWAAPVAVVVMLALLYIPFQGVISERLLRDDRGSAESRMPLMRLAFRIIEDNPVLGVGNNNFPVVMNRYATSEFRRGFFYTVHNKYMLVWAETGTFGLLAYLAFLLGTVHTGWRCWKSNDRLLSPLALGFTVALLGHMVQMGVEIFRGRPVVQLVWLTAGLLAAMHKMCVTPKVSGPLPDAI
jgi:putative inorganic carbon (HCO3(-)) transporter